MTPEGVFRPPFAASMPLVEAQGLLRDLARRGGHRCPVCTQLARVYRRRLTSVVVRAVAALYRTHGCDYGHMSTVVQAELPEVATQGGYAVLGQHWGLIEEERRQRPDGGRNGWWRVTDLGERFLRGEAEIPRVALVYDGRCLSRGGPPISVREAVGEGFHFAELLRGARVAADQTDPFTTTEEEVLPANG